MMDRYVAFSIGAATGVALCIAIAETAEAFDSQFDPLGENCTVLANIDSPEYQALCVDSVPLGRPGQPKVIHVNPATRVGPASDVVISLAPGTVCADVDGQQYCNPRHIAVPEPNYIRFVMWMVLGCLVYWNFGRKL